jgi:xanthine dehydrogenase/oxidase
MQPIYEIILSQVTSQGQIIGLIIADNQELAQRAAKAVKVEYKPLHPIITIEVSALQQFQHDLNVLRVQQAVEAKSIMPPTRTLRRGDVEGILKSAPHVVEGEMRIGGQEHFYLETQACIAVPKGEDGEIELFAATQDPTATQVCHLKLKLHLIQTFFQ